MMRPTIGHLLGYTALTVMLTAGAAQSLSGENTVFSDDIVDNHVTAADLGTNSVTRTEMADNAVSRAELADNAVSSAEVADGTITGNDVKESTLKLPGVIRTTGVDAAGAKIFGAGTATREGTGSYTVDYGFPVANCTAHTSIGYNYSNSIETYFGPGSAAVFPGYPTANVARIVVYNNANEAVDSSFFVTLFCASGSAGHTTSSQASSSQERPSDTEALPPQP